MRVCKVLLNDKILFDDARLMDTFFDRLVGLMFRRNPRHRVLVFKESGWIHSFFCYIPFNAIFVHKSGKILKHFTNIKGGKILPPVFKTEYVIEYLGEPLNFEEGDKIGVEA